MARGCVKSIFLDRDGVINVDTGYIGDFSRVEFILDTIQVLRKFTDEGVQLFVVTNQSGLARGYFDWQQYCLLNIKILETMRSYGVNIVEIFTCPHHPEGIVEKYKKECNCRKPKPGLILMACKKYNLDVSKCILVGDKVSDIQAGKAAGINKCYLLSNSHTTGVIEKEYVISSLRQLGKII